MIEAQATQHLHSDDWQRTVYIDTLDVATTDFDLSDKKKQVPVDSGRDCTNAYFEWFNSPDAEPVNRVAPGSGVGVRPQKLNDHQLSGRTEST